MRVFDRIGYRKPTKMAELRGESPTPIDSALSRIAAAGTIDDIIAALREHGRAVTGADGVTIVRRDGDEVVYVTEDAISPLWAGQRFPIRTCVSGLAIQARAPIVIQDIHNDRRVPLNAYLATFVKSMVMVPVGRDDPQMAIGAYWQVADPILTIATDRMTTLADAAAAGLGRIKGEPEAGRQVA